MTPERWAQIEELFHRAADCPPERRSQLLAEACNGNSDLRREVEVLLASEDSASHRMQAAVHGGLDAMTFPLVGKVVSHYRIVDGLGGGGMGLVYRAEDVKLGRQVALKFLPEDSAKDPAALGRFEREARSASVLEHPNICPIYEFGEHEGQPFLVMQLLQGRTLRELLSANNQAPLAVPEVLDLALQIAEGLEAAHGHGIIHRDIKPANIFVTTRGQAKILDFGLAKLTKADFTDDQSDQAGPGSADSSQSVHDTSSRATPDPMLSRTGVAMGTAGYMSPEQARGEKLDARTDVFSLGLVLYEMATGRPAFQGDTGPVLHDAILRSKPRSARKLNRNVPMKLEAILLRALEKERANRYQSAEELCTDLQKLQRALKARRLLWRWLPVSAAGLALVSGGTYWLERHQNSPAQSMSQVRFRQLTMNSYENQLEFGSASPDGNYLAYIDQQGIHIKDLQSGTIQAVAEPEVYPKDSVIWEIEDAAWLRDSSGFIANAHPASESPGKWSPATTTIWSFSRLGSPPRKLRENASNWEVLRDGSISFGTSVPREAWLMGPQGEGAHKILETDQNGGLVGPIAQSSADKQLFLCARHDSSGDSLFTQNARGGPPFTIFTAEENSKIPGDIAWLPDGRLIYQAYDHDFASAQDTCNFWTLLLDLHTGKPLGKPQRLTNWVGFCSSELGATADGKRVSFLQSTSHGTAYIGELAASGTRIVNSRHFTLDDADNAISDWTADSKSVILITNRPDRYELYKQSVTGGAPELLATVPGGAGTQAVVSPDGKWILVQKYSGPNEMNSFSRVPINGGPPELMFKGPTWFTNITCARPPSSRCITMDLSEDYRHMVVFELDPVKGRGAELARLEFDRQFDPKENIMPWNISPDGTRFAASRGRSGPIQIYSFQDHSIRLVQPKRTVDILNLTWSADGKAFYFANRLMRLNGGMELVYMDMQGNVKSLLWKSNNRTFAVPSPDGRYLAMWDSRTINNMWMMENF